MNFNFWVVLTLVVCTPILIYMLSHKKYKIPGAYTGFTYGEAAIQAIYDFSETDERSRIESAIALNKHLQKELYQHFQYTCNVALNVMSVLHFIIRTWVAVFFLYTSKMVDIYSLEMTYTLLAAVSLVSLGYYLVLYNKSRPHEDKTVYIPMPFTLALGRLFDSLLILGLLLYVYLGLIM